MVRQEREQIIKFLEAFSKRVLEGMRVTVEYILNLLALGGTVVEILEEYNGLTVEDERACLLFATKSFQTN